MATVVFPVVFADQMAYERASVGLPECLQLEQGVRRGSMLPPYRFIFNAEQISRETHWVITKLGGDYWCTDM